MKNFNIYDFMKCGQGFVFDGQIFVYIEVGIFLVFNEI